jgi:hypothetical protein
MIKKELLMKKNIKEIVLLSYCIGTFLLTLLLWNSWESIWYEYFSFFIPKFTVFVVPVSLAFSSVLIVVIGCKKIGLVFGGLGLVPIEYMLYMKNFIHVDSCPCSRLYPFLDTEIHLWINSVMLLFILVSIVINISYIRKNNTNKNFDLL